MGAGYGASASAALLYKTGTPCTLNLKSQRIVLQLRIGTALTLRTHPGTVQLLCCRTGVHSTCVPISPYSGRDCVKSLRSSYAELYPQNPPTPCTLCCRANVANIRHTRPAYGLVFQVKGLETFLILLNSLASGICATLLDE